MFKSALKENHEVMRNKELEIKKLREELTLTKRQLTSLKSQLSDSRDSVALLTERLTNSSDLIKPEMSELSVTAKTVNASRPRSALGLGLSMFDVETQTGLGDTTTADWIDMERSRISRGNAVQATLDESMKSIDEFDNQAEIIDLDSLSDHKESDIIIKPELINSCCQTESYTCPKCESRPSETPHDMTDGSRSASQSRPMSRDTSSSDIKQKPRGKLTRSKSLANIAAPPIPSRTPAASQGTPRSRTPVDGLTVRVMQPATPAPAVPSPSVSTESIAIQTDSMSDKFTELFNKTKTLVVEMADTKDIINTGVTFQVPAIDIDNAKSCYDIMVKLMNIIRIRYSNLSLLSRPGAPLRTLALASDVKVRRIESSSSSVMARIGVFASFVRYAYQ